MENFKKNKGFYILIAVLLAGFVAGVVLCFLANNKRVDTEDKLNKNLARYRKLLKGQELDGSSPAVSLSAKNVDASKQDTDALLKQRDDLRLAISGVSTNRFVGKENLASSDLASSIKQNVDEWTKLAADKDIRMLTNEKCEFGFRRYIRNPGTSPKGANLAKVDQQIQIIDFLFKTLADSRPTTPNRSAILLHSIDREPIETYEVIAAGKPNAGTFGPVEGARGENDEFLPTRSFRNPPLVEGLSFRVRFVATTPTLRTFINKIRNSGRPIVVTSIEISNPQPESLKVLGTNAIANLAAPGLVAVEPLDFMASPTILGSSATPTAPAKEERKVVVNQNFSEITLQIDYLYAPEDKPAAEAEPKK
ncbi:MAG: hypothetical protein CK519_03135 [Opitutia bacterium]|nr:hypothetical protein [Opitutales bacterium]PHX68772.1 MAG: hypothetical protein CK519_03135 [Opitutae bacterium]